MMFGMQMLPVPCPADRVPDVSSTEAFDAAYRAAKAAGSVYVGIERRGRGWAVKADTLTAPDHVVDDAAASVLSEAVVRLVIDREVRSHASAGPVYVLLNDIREEARARQLAAAVHAALYGETAPLRRAVPRLSRS